MSDQENKPRLLLIWENVPEDTQVYSLDRKSEQAEWARNSNKMFINGDDLEEDHPIFDLSNWLVTEEAKEYKVEMQEQQALRGKFSEVVLCGCLL